jgi:UDP-GlcNAc:undecaprenyl-phosphate GlcNAc-1-phosphate transferase
LTVLGLILASLGAAAAAMLFTRGARAVSLRCGIIDVPVARSSHTTPMPRLGGVAICAAATATWTIALRPWAGGGTFVALLSLGAVTAAAVGAYDDLRRVRPATKLAGEFVAAFWLVPALPDLTMPFALPASVVAVGCVLWLIGYMNAFNFMDGSDGLAAGFCAISATAIGVLALQVRAAPLAVVAFSAAGASLGFLPYNFPRATIFMGDAGSLFLGYTCAALVLSVIGRGVSPVAAALPLLPFLFDSAFTLVRRVKRREKILQAHRTHLYQRLIVAGRSHTYVARAYYAWALVSALLGIGYSMAGGVVRAALVAAAIVSGALAVAVVTGEERHRAANVS